MTLKSLITANKALKFTVTAANILRIAAIAYAAYKIISMTAAVMGKKGIRGLLP